MSANQARDNEPAVCEEEVIALQAVYGTPVRRHFDIELDDYMLSSRENRSHDRRAEVLFAITRPSGKVLLHTKPQYPQGIYRLFTGGIGLQEPVLTALEREVWEETGMHCEIQSFLGLCTYAFTKNDFKMEFATYLFHLSALADERPQPQDVDEIAQIGEIALDGLPLVAALLRGLNEERKVWGDWRAIGHDIAFQALSRRIAIC